MAGTEEIQQPKYVDFGEYILFQVRRTQNLIRQTDLMMLAAAVVSAVLFLLFAFILLDHWAFAQGLSRSLRWLGFWGISGTVLGALVYYWRTSAGKDVTQLYAAKTLEKAEQKFNNHLLTLVDLESNNVETSELIKNSLEKRAALTLNDLDVEHAVDRRALLHQLYLLLAGTVLIFGYAFLTPKSVSDSIWRILFPWTSTAAPTTTRIFDVEPGNVTVTRGSHVEVSAYVDGKAPEGIWLVYSTEDRSILDERIQLQENEDGLGKYVGLITGENGKGVDQPIRYYLLAGDGRTENYKISVRPAPQTNIQEIRIAPPAYTARAERTQQEGSLDAIEGSAVRLSAKSNMPIKKAWIQLYDSEDPSSRSGQLPLSIENETEIAGNWTLRFRDDGTYPRFYRIECETADGSRDPSPPLHAILIRPDERPEVRLIDPTSDLERPINVTVPLLIEAYDPDFHLSGLSVQVEKQGKIIASELIDAQNRQSLRTRYPLELKRLPVQPGDEISFWVEARDNREPYPNRRNTSKLRIRLTAAVDPQQAEKQEQEDKQRQKEIEQKIRSEQNPLENNREEENTPEQPEQPGKENSDDSEQSMKDASREGESSEKGNNPGEKSKQDKDGQTNQTGENKNQQKKSGQGENQPGKPGSDSQQNNQQKKSDKPKYSPDGEDDDRVLEKMIEKLRQKQEKEKRDSDQPAPDNQKPNDPNQNSTDDKTMPNQGDTPNENAPEKPGNSQTPADSSKENNPGEQNAEKNPGEKMNQKQPGDSPDKKEQSEKGTEKKPGDKNEKMKSNGKENSSEKNENANEQQSEKGESQKEEMTGDNQKGEAPGEKKSDKPSGDSKPGPGDTPDPNGDDSGQKPRKPKPGEKTDGEKKPAKQSGKGEAKPGKGDEKGPTEKEKSKGEKPPVSQNQPASEQMKKSENSGKPSGQDSPNSSKPNKNSSSSSKKNGDSSQNKSGKSGNKPSSKQGKQQEKSSPENQQGKPSETDSKPGEKPSSQKNPSEMKPKSGEQTNEKPNQKPSSEKAPEQSKKQGAPDNKQGKNGGDKKQGEKSGKGKGEGKAGDKSGKQGGKEGGKSGGKPSAGGNRSKGEGISEKVGDAPDSDKPGNNRGGQGKQGKPSNRPASDGTGTPENRPSEQSLEDRKKAAELVLKELEDELKRGKVDPQLLEELGWNEDNLKQFQQRLADYLRHQKEEGKPDLKQKQFEEMLKNMRLGGKRKTRSGNSSGTASPDEFAPVMIPAPAEYREIGRAFKKSLSESKNKKP